MALLGLSMDASPALADPCVACSGLEKGGGDVFFRLESPPGQTFAPGKIQAYTRKGSECCLAKSTVTAPSARLLWVDPVGSEAYLLGMDGLQNGVRTDGVIAYNLVAGTMGPVALRNTLVRRCRESGTFALVRNVGAVPAAQRAVRKTRKQRPERALDLLVLEAGLPPRVLTVASAKELGKAIFPLSLSFSEDCRTLAYRASRSKKLTRFVVKDLPVEKPVNPPREVVVAVQGLLTLPSKLQAGQSRTFPVEVAFTVEQILPQGEVSGAGLKVMTLRLNEARFASLGLNKLPVGAPIQAVLKGDDRTPLKDFVLVSIQHR